MSSWGRDKVLGCAALVVLGCACATTAEAQSLRGSKSSLNAQNRQAAAHDFTFLRDGAHVRRFVQTGLLVRVAGNRDYILKDVSFPYARPEVKLFIERLSSQFRSACGERLVVTSLTRPRANQPRNASARSVHPTGMALDIRRHNTPACRSWLERVLLSLEEARVLEATLERNPPHYHVALYPQPYARYVRTKSRAAREAGFTDVIAYTVSRRDTLWRIAKSHGTTPAQIQQANNLRSTVIYPGQELRIPVAQPR